MELPAIIAVAVSLSMDAFAVSVVTGAAYKELHIRHTLRMATFFGGFQAFMPAIGYLAGLTVRQYISDYAHWVAFGILAAIGLKMIYESFKIKSERRVMHPANLALLLALAVATSIDALAVGITLSIITNSITEAIIIIGLVTFVLSCVGVTIGKRFGHFFESGIEAIGGLVLIGLGAKILFEHLVF
ncbi:MAG: manganese efflux pump MntP family protein [Sedimentisphaerales bacterium]